MLHFGIRISSIEVCKRKASKYCREGLEGRFLTELLSSRPLLLFVCFVRVHHRLTGSEVFVAIFKFLVYLFLTYKDCGGSVHGLFSRLMFALLAYDHV